jgi:glycosyltransferase involved in cell wall biosynthesis
MSSAVVKRYRVGIDLAPAELRERAPGTARHVTEQARALFRLDVPWEWCPLVRTKENPLYDEILHLSPTVVTGRKVALRASFGVGIAWSRLGCSLGFATAYFVPAMGPPVVANFFDALLFTHGTTWVTSGKGINLRITRTLAKYALHRARRLFVLSNDAATEIARQFPTRATKLRVIPCGVAKLSDHAAEEPRWAKNLARPFFLNVGEISENKGQARLLDCWHSLQATDPELPPLVCIGSYDQSYYDREIRQRIAKLSRERVRVTGFVSDAELAWAYRHALAYVQASYNEGFGLPVVEAMSAGVPVVISDAPGLIELAADAAVVFSVDDPQDLRRVVLKVWKDDKLRRQIAMRGLARQAQYTWSTNARAVAAELDQCLAEITARGVTGRR